MAPMVMQDSFDLSFLDCGNLQLDSNDLKISFEEIADLAEGEGSLLFDNTKLMENNGLGVGLPTPPALLQEQPAAPCAVMVQPASPDDTFTQMQELQPVSPEMALLQPVSPGTLIESAPSPSFSQDLLYDPDYLQPVRPESAWSSYSGQTLSPQSSPEPDYLQPEVLAGEPASPVQFAGVEQLLVPLPKPIAVVKMEAASALAPTVSSDAPKKRGRKRKYPEGTAPRRSRPRKPKVYEMGPLADQTEEKKRRNAVNAKRHRDQQKNERVQLAQQLKVVTAERDILLKQVEELKKSEAELRLRLAQATRHDYVLM